MKTKILTKKFYKGFYLKYFKLGFNLKKNGIQSF